MTTFIYTLALNDSEAITVSDALSMLANSNERNADIARKLIDRIHENATQTSGNNFNLLPSEEPSIINFKTDLFDD